MTELAGAVHDRNSPIPIQVRSSPETSSCPAGPMPCTVKLTTHGRDDNCQAHNQQADCVTPSHPAHLRFLPCPAVQTRNDQGRPPGTAT